MRVVSVVYLVLSFVQSAQPLNEDGVHVFCWKRLISPARTLRELIWENIQLHYRFKLSVINIEDLDHSIGINHAIDVND